MQSGIQNSVNMVTRWNANKIVALIYWQAGICHINYSPQITDLVTSLLFVSKR